MKTLDECKAGFKKYLTKRVDSEYIYKTSGDNIPDITCLERINLTNLGRSYIEFHQNYQNTFVEVKLEIKSHKEIYKKYYLYESDFTEILCGINCLIEKYLDCVSLCDSLLCNKVIIPAKYKREFKINYILND
jgi:hypothetical protein